MKAILISIKPKWCAKIMNGEKTIEVRKDNVGKAVQKLIDEQGFADIYVYCTKKEELFYSRDTQKWYVAKNRKNIKRLSNSVVKFKFRCYKVEKIYSYLEPEQWYATSDLGGNGLLRRSCLTFEELDNYLLSGVGCAIHISDLEIFDEPKELSEFYKANEHMEYIKSLWNNGGLPDKDDYDEVRLTKVPQSFCYIEVE